MMGGTARGRTTCHAWTQSVASLHLHNQETACGGRQRGRSPKAKAGTTAKTNGYEPTTTTVATAVAIIKASSRMMGGTARGRTTRHAWTQSVANLHLPFFSIWDLLKYDRMKGLPRIICVPHVAMQEYHALISNKYIKLPPLSTISRPFILFKSIIRIRSSLRMGELQAHRSTHSIAMQLFPTSYAGDIYCMFALFANISMH